MDELTELLYVTGLLESETQITDNNYIAKGIRIRTLARERQKRLYTNICDLTVRFDDLNIKFLSYDANTAEKQLKAAIKRKVRKICVAARSNEALETTLLPHLDELTTDMDHITVRKCESSWSYGLACAVGRTNQALQIDINKRVYYIPINPQKSFRDTEYFYKSMPDIKRNILHIETIYLYLYVIYNLNWLLSGFADQKLLYSLIKGYANHKAAPLLSGSWHSECMPEWLFKFLISNGYVVDDHGKLIKPFHNGSCFNYSTDSWADNYKYLVEYAYTACELPASSILEDLYRSQSLEIIIDFGIHVLRYLLSISHEIELSYKEEEKQHAYAATVYMTKRNIPKKIAREMESSPLNEYFDFVEYDEGVDLGKVRSVANEFMLINRDIFSCLKYPGKSIRFRKLGRHRAKGLYFPFYGTLAVDIRHPDSCIHEQFHLIDDLLGNLSSNFGFSTIADRYQYLLMQRIKEDEIKGIRHVSKSGKYNLKYYLKRTEIFARCGEIYLSRIKGVKSSLLKQDDNQLFSYPNDGKLNELISNYYGRLLSDIKNRQKQQKEDDIEKNIHCADR